ncbi:MAG: hypothetical protein OXE77_06485 [Flavobacteriaceae bacterium]|nr:hypothetical protein [Flavobacteriaceae bacterium]MCY4299669.1 hypothetical protein [Flavobacteriaceae bacterium]
MAQFDRLNHRGSQLYWIGAVLKRDSKEIASYNPIRFKNGRMWSLK